MSLKKYIASRNQLTALWGKAGEPLLPTNPKDLTADQKRALARGLLSDLSPENLCCDGELRGAKLRAKTSLLNKAKSELEVMGQSVEWEVLYPT